MFRGITVSLQKHLQICRKDSRTKVKHIGIIYSLNLSISVPPFLIIYIIIFPAPASMAISLLVYSLTDGNLRTTLIKSLHYLASNFADYHLERVSRVHPIYSEETMTFI